MCKTIYTNRFNHLICCITPVTGSIGIFNSIFMQRFIHFCCKTINYPILLNCRDDMITPIMEFRQPILYIMTSQMYKSKLFCTSQIILYIPNYFVHFKLFCTSQIILHIPNYFIHPKLFL